MATQSIVRNLSPVPASPYSSLHEAVIDWTDDLFSTYAEDPDRDKEIRNYCKIIDYLSGKQWSPDARFARSKPVINKFHRHWWEAVGMLTDLALDFQIKLFDSGDNYSEFQSLLNKLAIAWAGQNDFEDRVYDVVVYGLLNTGYSKLQWNSSLNGGLGDVEMIPIAPWNFAVVGGSNLQDAEAAIYYHVVTLEHLRRTYGDAAKNVKPDSDYSGRSGSFGSTSADLRPSHISKQSWDKLGPTLRQGLAAKYKGTESDSSSPFSARSMLKEFWLRDDRLNETGKTQVVGPRDENGKPAYNWCYYAEPGEKLYPRGRVIVTAGGCALADAPNPYWHAFKPFSVFRPYRVPWSLEGNSIVGPWLQMQNVTNRIYGGVLDMIKAIIEPTLIAPKAAFPPQDWDALDPGASGGKIKYNNNSPRAPEFAKKGEMPGWVFQYLELLDREYGMSSGASAVNQALGKKQVPGGDAMEMIINSRSYPVKVQSRSLTSFVKDIGYQGIANILQFYSVAHRASILGAKGFSSSDYTPMYGQAKPESMKGEDFVRKFAFVVKPGSLLASEKTEKIQIALELQKRGILSAKNLFRLLDSNLNWEQNRDELLEEAAIKLKIAGAAAALTGKGAKK